MKSAIQKIRHQEILTTAQMYETIVFAPLTSAAVMNAFVSNSQNSATVYGFTICQIIMFSFLMQANYFDYSIICL